MPTFPIAGPSNEGSVPKVLTIFDVSSEFLGQLKTWLEQNPPSIPITQILGFTQFTAQYASVGTEAHTTSSTYADPSVSGGNGPEIDALPNGNYIVLFGGSGGGDFATNTTYHMAVSVNGDTPTDDKSAEFSSDRGNTSGMTGIIAALNNSGNNTLKAVYRSSDGTDRGNIRYRWMIALRYSN